MEDLSGPTLRLGQPKQDAERASAERLGRYPLIGKLGAGGMGQVLEVADEDLGRIVAAKLIAGRAGDALRAKFVQEAQITGQLEHPNIVPIYELGAGDDGSLYYTMKRVQGRTLEQIIECGEHSLIQLLQIFAKVCDAIELAHARGVIHRDLKPANIMVGAFGEVLVLDWGLARVVGQADPGAEAVALDLSRAGQAGALQTLDGQVVGTPAYMPPEQARGRILLLDARSDIYSLGAILYQMLTGEPPYSGSDLWQVVSQVAAGKLIPPSRRTPERRIPRELEAVVLQAMAQRQADRYGTVAELRADLESFIEGRALAAASYNPLQLLCKWAARHRTLVAAAGVVLLVSVFSFWQVLRQRDIARAERDEARRARQAEARQNRLNTAILQVQLAEQLHRSRGDQRQIAKLVAVAESAASDYHGLLRFKALLAIERGELARAAPLIERALVRAPEDYRLHALRYRLLAEQGQGRSPAAERHVRLVARYAPADSAAGRWGQAYRLVESTASRLDAAARQQLERATAVAGQALALEPDFVWALLLRAQCYRRLGRNHQALADLDRLLAVTHSRPALLQRAVVRNALGQHREALQDLQRLAEGAASNAGQARMWFQRGRAHQGLGEEPQALAAYGRVIALDPTWAEAHSNRAVLHLRQRRWEQARADLERALQLDPRLPEAQQNLALIELEQGRPRQALAPIRRAFQLDPERPATAWLLRGRIEWRLGLPVAEHSLSEALRRDPRLAPAWLDRGRLRMEAGRMAPALSDFERVLALQPRNARALVERGNLHGAAGRLPQAEADFERALAIDPRLPAAYYSRGILRAGQRRHPEALADYGRALELDPRLLPAWINRGGLLAHLGRHQAALADFRRALPLARGGRFEALVRRQIAQLEKLLGQ